MKRRPTATLHDFFTKKLLFGKEKDAGLCCSKDHLRDVADTQFGRLGDTTDKSYPEDGGAVSNPACSGPDSTFVRETPEPSIELARKGCGITSTAAVSPPAESVANAELRRKRRRRVTHALFSEDEEDDVAKHVDAPPRAAPGPPSETGSPTSDTAGVVENGKVHHAPESPNAEPSVITATAAAFGPRRYGNSRLSRLLPTELSDNDGQGANDRTPRLHPSPALMSFSSLDVPATLDSETVPAPLLMDSTRMGTPKEPSSLDWANVVDDSITLYDGGGLPSSQTSGSYGQEDPTPIPIPRRSMPASLDGPDSSSTTMLFGRLPCNAAFITPPASTAPPLASPHDDSLNARIATPLVCEATNHRGGLQAPLGNRRHTIHPGGFIDAAGPEASSMSQGECIADDKPQTGSETLSSGTQPKEGSSGLPSLKEERREEVLVASTSDQGEAGRTGSTTVLSLSSCISDTVKKGSQSGAGSFLFCKSESGLAAAAAGATGSLFGVTVVTPDTPAVSDPLSPQFDPAACDSTLLLQKAVAKGTSSSSLRFSYVADMFNKIEALRGSGSGSKKRTAVLLTNLFRVALWYSPVDLVPLAYICLNKTAPDYQNAEIGIGEALLLKLLTEVYGRSEKCVKSDLAKYEDLGRVAELSRCKMRVLFNPPPLTIHSVFTELKALPTITGQVSQTKKKEKIKKLLVAANGSEAKYIVRFLQGRMRMGVQAVTIYQAIAFAFVLTRPPPALLEKITPAPQPLSVDTLGSSDTRRDKACPLVASNVEKQLVAMETAVRTALSEVSNIEVVVRELFNGTTSDQLQERCTVRPGIPVQPMLAKPTKGLEEIFQRFASCEFTCEFKYDGERAQIHLLADGSVALFSRNLETLTEKYPDVVLMIKEAFSQNVTECILDAEIAAYDTQQQRILPFQILSTRKRKGAEAGSSTVKVCVFVFDCVAYNGESLLKLPLIERRNYLQNALREIPHQVTVARHMEMVTLEDVDAFLQEALEANCEGLMIKTLKQAASYEPSKRSYNWLKLKKDYLENLTDSVDLVPMGAYLGRGKRSKVYGAYLLGCYHHDEEVYQTICKAGTGFSDEDLQTLYTQLQDHITSAKDPSYQVDDKMTPDVWFRPSVVWEVRAADLSLSPVHTAAMGMNHLTRGIGLRFPRFVRTRPDKRPDLATTAAQIAEMYENQTYRSKQDAPSLTDGTTANITDTVASEDDEDNDRPSDAVQ